MIFIGFLFLSARVFTALFFIYLTFMTPTVFQFKLYCIFQNILHIKFLYFQQFIIRIILKLKADCSLTICYVNHYEIFFLIM